MSFFLSVSPPALSSIRALSTSHSRARTMPFTSVDLPSLFLKEFPVPAGHSLKEFSCLCISKQDQNWRNSTKRKHEFIHLFPNMYFIKSKMTLNLRCTTAYVHWEEKVQPTEQWHTDGTGGHTHLHSRLHWTTMWWGERTYSDQWGTVIPECSSVSCAALKIPPLKELTF